MAVWSVFLKVKRLVEKLDVLKAVLRVDLSVAMKVVRMDG